MRLLNRSVFLLLMLGVFSPLFAAVDSGDAYACKIFSDKDDGDKKDGGNEEEEPDCE
jgi:hypothetical protein